jgi:concanavalin A-like lectin/glucanase superfamily protein
VLRRRLALLVATAMMLVIAASPAWAVLLKSAVWEMNETSGQMLDSSGNNNNGTPSNVVQGVQEDVDGDGVDESTYVFNGSNGSGTIGNEADPSHVVVPDADSLDPQANDITLTARVKVNGGSLDDDSYDVVRKGLVTTEGGDYKMEIKRMARDHTVGKLHCFFRGDQASANKVANRDIVDGNWHKLECIKTGTSVVARVDGGRSFTKTGSAGSIANASNVMVGAKQVTLSRGGDLRGDDVFDGSMDFVSIEIAQPDIAP